MAWIYRYKDIFGDIKYIGIVWGKDRTLEQRIGEHTMDWWYKESPEWVIEYMEESVPNRATAEALESHFISKYNTGFTTGNGFNKSKDGWGEISLFQYLKEDWKTYGDRLDFELLSTTDFKNKAILTEGERRPLNYKHRAKYERNIRSLDCILNALRENIIPDSCGFEFSEWDYCDSYSFWFKCFDDKIKPICDVLDSWQNIYRLRYKEEYFDTNTIISEWKWGDTKLLYIEPSEDNPNCPIFKELILIDKLREERCYSGKDYFTFTGSELIAHQTKAALEIIQDDQFEVRQAAIIYSFLKPLRDLCEERFICAEDTKNKLLNDIINPVKKEFLSK